MNDDTAWLESEAQEILRHFRGASRGQMTWDELHAIRMAEATLEVIAEVDRLRMAEAEAMALVLSHEAVIERLRCEVEVKEDALRGSVALIAGGLR